MQNSKSVINMEEKDTQIARKRKMDNVCFSL